MTDVEWEAMCGVVADRMKEFTRVFVTPLLHEPAGAETVYGTGTYVDLSGIGSGATTLITCEHVVALQPQSQAPYGSEQPIPLSGRLYMDRHPVDAATVAISELAWHEHAHLARSVSLERFAPQHSPAPDELLFFRGLAGENAFQGFGGLEATITGYCSQEKRGSGDKQMFEILWNPSGTKVTPGTDPAVSARVKFQNAKGYSGSLIWNTRFVELGCDLGRWSPSEAVVTGLLRRWDTGTRTLLAWRVEHLLAWLKSRPASL